MYKRTAAYRMDYRASKKWRRIIADCVMINLGSDAAYSEYLKSQLSQIGLGRGFRTDAVYVRNDIIVIHVSDRSRERDAIYFTKDLSARMLRRVDSQINALQNISKGVVSLDKAHAEEAPIDA